MIHIMWHWQSAKTVSSGLLILDYGRLSKRNYIGFACYQIIILARRWRRCCKWKWKPTEVQRAADALLLLSWCLFLARRINKWIEDILVFEEFFRFEDTLYLYLGSL